MFSLRAIRRTKFGHWQKSRDYFDATATVSCRDLYRVGVQWCPPSKALGKASALVVHQAVAFWHPVLLFLMMEVGAPLHPVIFAYVLQWGRSSYVYNSKKL